MTIGLLTFLHFGPKSYNFSLSINTSSFVLTFVLWISIVRPLPWKFRGTVYNLTTFYHNQVNSSKVRRNLMWYCWGTDRHTLLHFYISRRCTTQFASRNGSSFFRRRISISRTLKLNDLHGEDDELNEPTWSPPTASTHPEDSLARLRKRTLFSCCFPLALRAVQQSPEFYPRRRDGVDENNVN